MASKCCFSYLLLFSYFIFASSTSLEAAFSSSSLSPRPSSLVSPSLMVLSTGSIAPTTSFSPYQNNSQPSAAACTGCCVTDIPSLPTEGIPAVTAPPGEFDAQEVGKRGMAHRYQRIQKRDWPPKTLTKINGCVLRTPKGWPVTTPAYPHGQDFYTSDKNDALGSLTTISRYYRSTNVGAPACTPTLVKINAAQWTFSQDPGAPENDKVSIDHAYENNFLTSFMQSVINKPGGVTCDNTNSQFFDQGCPDNRLEPIFGSLPSYDNLDFVVMSQWLNGDAKAWVLGPTYDPQLNGFLLPGARVRSFHDWDSTARKIFEKLSLAQILLGASLIINADNTIPQMQKTNNRIYRAFQEHDSYLAQRRGLPQSNFGWAAKYRSYMNTYMSARSGATGRLLAELLSNIASDLDVAKNIHGKVQQTWDQYNNLHNAIQSHYTGNGAGAHDIAWAINWEWNTANIKRNEINRRVGKTQACSKSPSWNSSTSAIPIITAPSSMSCVYQDATPETSEACTCIAGSSTTVVSPLTLSSVSVITQSCDYSTWPTSAPMVTQPPASVTTDWKGCQICTAVGPNEDNCFPLPSSKCTTTGTSTVLSAGTSGVNVGTLTGSAFYSAITSAIDQVCEVPTYTGGAQPTGVFTCTETATATVASNILYKEERLTDPLWKHDGVLTLQITEASYDTGNWYETNKAIIAAFAQNSTQGNCNPTKAQDAGEPSEVLTADVGPNNGTYSICQVGSNYQLIVNDPDPKIKTRELSFDLRFQVDSKDTINCEFLKDVVEFAELAVNVMTDTEALIPEELAVDGPLLDACKGLNDLTSG